MGDAPDELLRIKTKLGLSHQDLADALGVHRRSVQKWIGRERRIPADALMEAQRLERAFDVGKLKPPAHKK